MELRAIAAAVIGGTSLRGGRVSIAGAAVGAIVLALSSALAQFQIPLIWNAFATGLAILTAISIDTLLRRGVSLASRQQGTSGRAETGGTT